MRILAIDIENKPNLVYRWSLFDKSPVNPAMLVEAGEVICFAAKFLGDRGTEFHAVWQPGGKAAMLQRAHELLDEADMVIHWNGRRHDIPHLNAEFLQAGMLPPAPFADVDLYLAARQRFKMPSLRMGYVAQALGLETKLETGGFDLWLKVMAGDELAQRRMQRYNKRDVTVLESLYYPLRPWIKGHPSVPLRDGGCETCCPACSSDHVQRRGFSYTGVSQFQRYQCQSCGHWFRGTSRVAKVSTAQAA